MNDRYTSTAIFQPAEVTSAFLKMGIMGKQGAGKSKTAAKVAIGLIQHLKKLGIDYASKPVAFFDTETGSDWLIPDFKAAGIPLVVAKKKSFADLLAAVRWAEQNASALIIDSITHPYRELIAAYLKKKQRTFLQIDDWNYIKGEHGWAQFTELYINSNLHIIMCGRAGDDLEQYTDENGKRQLEKVGVKMKTEAETGFEPSLLVLMERNMNTRTNEVTHTATVLKDRSTILDGAEFDDPGFENFLPHIQLLNLGGAHVGIGASDDSQRILKTEKRDWQPVQRRVAIDEIQTLLVLHVPGQGAADKQRKVQLIRRHFHDASWTEIEELMPLRDLRAGYDTLHQELEGKPSRYAAFLADSKVDIDDALPDHSAAPATAPSGDAPALSLKDRLLADLKELKTTSDCLSWGITVSNMKDVTADEYIELSKALMARQQEIAKNPGNGNGSEPDEPKKNEPDGGKGGEDAPPAREPKPEPEERRPAARGKAKDRAISPEAAMSVG
jgi:hypothetical protein